MRNRKGKLGDGTIIEVKTTENGPRPSRLSIMVAWSAEEADPFPELDAHQRGRGYMHITDTAPSGQRELSFVQRATNLSTFLRAVGVELLLISESGHDYWDSLETRLEGTHSEKNHEA